MFDTSPSIEGGDNNHCYKDKLTPHQEHHIPIHVLRDRSDFLQRILEVWSETTRVGIMDRQRENKERQGQRRISGLGGMEWTLRGRRRSKLDGWVALQS